MVRNLLICSQWRPWLIFSIGRYKARAPLLDGLVAERDVRTVEDHPCRQTLGPFRSIVTAVTKPGAS